MTSRKKLDVKFAALERASQACDAPKYWRCLEELVDTEAFRELMRQEFPALADVWPDQLCRRKFLSLMGASLSLAGIGGCSVRPAPEGTIVPYVHPPENSTMGVPLFYATTMVHDGDAVGLLVESHEGRPTKIEGNPDHPGSLGATNVFHQASVLTLYDPARSQTIIKGDHVQGWDELDAAIESALAGQRESEGAGLRLLTETVTSPTLIAQIDQFLQRFPRAKWCHYSPVDSGNSARAAKDAFGDILDPRYDFTKADVVLALDADFLATGPGHLHYARDFMSKRRVPMSDSDAESASMNRLYVAEPAVSCTGVKADHRLALKMSEVEPLARQIANELGISQVSSGGSSHTTWAAAVARDLTAHQGNCLVLVGPRQPVAVHLLAHAMNHQLGNIGNTVSYIQPVHARLSDPTESLRQLVRDMKRGDVETLFILGGNPVYTAPGDVDFGNQMQQVPQSFHLSLYEDETSRSCTWHIPETHYLEDWGDARAFDGTASLVQPLISPLYESASLHEVMAKLTGHPHLTSQDVIQEHWREWWRQNGAPNEDFEEFWKTSLHDGVIANTTSSSVSVQLRDDWQTQLQEGPQDDSEESGRTYELIFSPDPTIYDGRYALNGWLQELPKPITKLTWDNAAIMSPATARALQLEFQSFAHAGEHGGYYVPKVKLQSSQRTVEAPIWIMPGHVDGAVTVYLGHGRTSAARANGRWQSTLGFDAYQLRTWQHLWQVQDLVIEKLDAIYPLACTQAHHTMDEREPVRSTTLENYRQKPREAVEQHEEKEAKSLEHVVPPTTLYEPYEYDPPKNKWGMSIDTTACIGCNACVVACQAENNIPVVGKEQVLMGREMHWIRIDRYVRGDVAQPDEFYFQPVPCMHCEHAPCEYVCPVEATVHSAEGLNDMIYNRCVGTRFCSNNCPYKVRRFNFLAFSEFDDATPRSLQYNPDVTVRSRGVMEKCTYCVQRIRQAEINALEGNRSLSDGEVLTACQAACPTQAIVFGDMNDAESVVAKCKDSPLDYGLLAELNTLPRTTYLAAVRNPNPELKDQ